MKSNMILSNKLKNMLLGLSMLSVLAAAFFFGISQYVHEVLRTGTIEMVDLPAEPEPLFYRHIGISPSQELPQPLEPLPQYTVELLTTENEQLAKKLVKTFSSKGVEIFYTPMNHKGKIIYHVRSGVFSTIELAERQARFLHKELNKKGSIRRL